jgi:hypothetical protein
VLVIERSLFLQLADIVAKVGEGRLGRNNRIGRSESLNQPCVSGADLESMLLPRTPKIFLQQYRPDSEAPTAGPAGPLIEVDLPYRRSEWHGSF